MFCSQPIDKSMKIENYLFDSKQKKKAYSNYATLQGILNSLKLSSRNNPPELCCAPSLTESLPLLYIDKNSMDHVVKILCKFKECKNWEEAFEFGAPKRWKRE